MRLDATHLLKRGDDFGLHDLFRHALVAYVAYRSALWG